MIPLNPQMIFLLSSSTYNQVAAGSELETIPFFCFDNTNCKDQVKIDLSLRISIHDINVLVIR